MYSYYLPEVIKTCTCPSHAHLFLLVIFLSLLVLTDGFPHCVCWLNPVLVQARAILLSYLVASST